MKKGSKALIKAVDATAPQMPKGKEGSVTVTIKKIDNGYIHRTEHFSDGDYKCNEVYSKTGDMNERASTPDNALSHCKKIWDKY
jgi:hypothetical protein